MIGHVEKMLRLLQFLHLTMFQFLFLVSSAGKNTAEDRENSINVLVNVNLFQRSTVWSIVKSSALEHITVSCQAESKGIAAFIKRL